MKLCKSVFVVLLAGCATFGQLEEGLAGLMGSHEREAFSVLGYPSSKQEFGDDVVYAWYLNQSGTLFLPQTTTTTGYVGRMPVYGTTNHLQAMPLNHNCEIKLVANRNSGILNRWEYNGNLGGCTPYVKRLNAREKSSLSSYPSEPVPMQCQEDADCGNGNSCRSRRGGGTECRPSSTD